MTDPAVDIDSPGPEAPPIARHSLHAQVVNRVRDMIIDGRLLPGTRIHETRLCESIGVSRTPLREALKVLANEGLIELVPSRGAVVRSFTAKDARDSLFVLGHLEGLAAALACETASDADIAAVRKIHDAMMRNYAERNRMEYFKLNQQIHSEIARLSGNAVLFAMHQTLQARLKRVRYLGHDRSEQWQAAVAEHEQMIRCLEARDGAGLAAAVRAHINQAWERVSQIFP